MIKRNILNDKSPSNKHPYSSSSMKPKTLQKLSYDQKTTASRINSSPKNNYLVSEFNAEEKSPENTEHIENLKLIQQINKNVVESGTNTVSLVNYLLEYVRELEFDRQEKREAIKKLRVENRILSNDLHRSRIQARVNNQEYRRVMWQCQMLKEQMQKNSQQQTLNQTLKYRNLPQNEYILEKDCTLLTDYDSINSTLLNMTQTGKITRNISKQPKRNSHSYMLQ